MFNKKNSILTKIVAGIILFAPIIVLLSFWIPMSKNVITSQLLIADWMVFATAVLSYIGTVTFGFAVYYQSERFQKIENERIRVQNLPLFSLQRFYYADFGIHGAASPRNQLIFDPVSGETPGASTSKVSVNGICVYQSQNGELKLSGAYDSAKVEVSSLVNMLILTNCGNNTANSISISLAHNNASYDRMFCLAKDDGIALLPLVNTNFTLNVEYHDLFMNRYNQKFEFFIDDKANLTVKDILPEQNILSRGDILTMTLSSPDDDSPFDNKLL